MMHGQKNILANILNKQIMYCSYYEMRF